MRDPSAWLRDIWDAITAIERYSVRGRSAFENEELIQIWIIHHLQIIGEAAGRLGGDFQLAHAQLPWPAIVAMRNVLVHDYFGTDLEEVWRTVERDLPTLRDSVESLLEELSPGGA
jgi:uncharacterized protein with HEPN domain